MRGLAIPCLLLALVGCGQADAPSSSVPDAAPVVVEPELGDPSAQPGASAAPQAGCEAVGPARPVCGFQNPEDLALLPDGFSVIVSEFGEHGGAGPGRLALLDLRNDERRDLFRGGSALEPEQRWGDADCPGPPGEGFSPHGIHLSARDAGAWQLLVVQHAGRESIEFFEVSQRDDAWSAHWRGCAIPPADTWLNSVAALPDGGFVTTKIHSRSAGDEGLAESYSASEPVITGHVWEWQPGDGFTMVPGTESSLPNGIEVSADGETIFVNVSGAGEVWRVSRTSGEVTGKAEVASTDNATWAPDGRLVVASLHIDPGAFGECLELEPGQYCPLPFSIVAIDPDSMETEVLYRNQGPPLGAGTVGLVVGDELLIGSFAGDRILRVSLTEPASEAAEESPDS